MSNWFGRAFSVKGLVSALMKKYPELYAEKPAAYKNRQKLVLHVRSLTKKEYSPETVLRSQRLVWEDWRKNYEKKFC